jgi:serine/threonine protein kinase
MSLQKNFAKSLQKRYPPEKYILEPLNQQYNVMRLRNKKTNETFIAKTLIAFNNEAEHNEQKDFQFLLETQILKQLPSWWGLQYMDSFRDLQSRFDHKIIVTREVTNLLSWDLYDDTKNPANIDILQQIIKQINWLHSNGIVHNDLELKNILLRFLPKSRKYGIVIIDFEKSFLSNDPKDFKLDWAHLVNTFLFNGFKRLAYLLSLYLLNL